MAQIHPAVTRIRQFLQEFNNAYEARQAIPSGAKRWLARFAKKAK
jgi:hypothetical protein